MFADHFYSHPKPGFTISISAVAELNSAVVIFVCWICRQKGMRDTSALLTIRCHIFMTPRSSQSIWAHSVDHFINALATIIKLMSKTIFQETLAKKAKKTERKASRTIDWIRVFRNPSSHLRPTLTGGILSHRLITISIAFITIFRKKLCI